MDVFAKALRQKLRFPSLIGDLTIEQLWDLPISNKGIRNKASLVDIGKSLVVDRDPQLPDFLVTASPDPSSEKNVLRLSVLQAIIETKREEERDREAKDVKMRQVNLLREMIMKRELTDLESHDTEALRNMLKELGG